LALVDRVLGNIPEKGGNSRPFLPIWAVKKKIKYFWDSPGLKLDLREDIKLFLKLPEKFTIDTPFVK
jgi:hypothetical protein